MPKFNVTLHLEATYTIEAEDQKAAETLAEDFASDIDANELTWMGKTMLIRADVGDVDPKDD